MAKAWTTATWRSRANCPLPARWRRHLCAAEGRGWARVLASAHDPGMQAALHAQAVFWPPFSAIPFFEPPFLAPLCLPILLARKGTKRSALRPLPWPSASLLLAACCLLACGPAYWRVFTSKVQARQALGGGGRRWQGLHLRFFQFLASLLPALIGPYRPLPAPPVPAHDHPALPPPPCPDSVDVMPTPSACAAALDRGGAAQRLVGGSSAGGRAGQQRHGGGTNACSCRCHVPACAQRRRRTRLRP